MADTERPDRITNVTGLRAQPESGPAAPAAPERRPARWPATACRLCRRPVWVFARTCDCGMPAPGRDARLPFVVRGAAAATVLVAIGWWVARQ